MARRRRLGVRARIAAGSVVVAIGVAGTLAGLAYQRTRTVLVSDRRDAAVVQTFVNARLVRDALRSPDVEIAELLASLSTSSRSEPLLRKDARWHGRSVAVDVDDLPSELQARVLGGGASTQRFVVDGHPLLGVGVPLPAAAAEYFEVFPLEDVESTLRTLSTALWTGAGVAAVAVAAVALVASRRVLRPIATAAGVARQIAGGDLETRMAQPADRELIPLVDALNEMAASLAARVERDRRFASEVSHELRSPLTSLRTAMDVAVRRLPPLDERAQVAVDLALVQLERFERMTLDLLEISRIDAGIAVNNVQEVDAAACVRDLVGVITNHAVPVRTSDRAERATASVDVDRLEWTLASLLANAQHHAGGAIEVGADVRGDRLVVTVDDAGPGVPVEERERVFERFARGAAARATPGSGLGLALAREHVRIMGGTVVVADSPRGGARFVVEVPIAGTAA